MSQTLNSELFRQIADVIEKEPKCYDQGLFCAEKDTDRDALVEFEVDDTPVVNPLAIGECGTVGCIAGWATFLTPKDKRVGESFSEIGKNALGIGDGEAGFLFSSEWSPKEGVTVPQELRRIADQKSVFETVTGGDDSTVTGGYRSTVTGGDDSTVTGGYRSTVTGGDDSTVTGGDYSTVTGGYRSTVTGGYRSTVTGGKNGIVVVYRIKSGNRVPVVGAIGETKDATGEALKPNVKYILNCDGQFAEAIIVDDVQEAK